MVIRCLDITRRGSKKQSQGKQKIEGKVYKKIRRRVNEEVNNEILVIERFNKGHIFPTVKII